jgi:hypothetical protein
MTPYQNSPGLTYAGSSAAGITNDQSTGSITYTNVDGSIHWHEGKILANGAIFPEGINEQVAVPAGPPGIVPWRPALLYDSNNHAWITYAWINTTSQTESQMVTENQKTDGNWSTAPGFPKTLATGIPVNHAVDIVKLTNGRMYFIRGDGSRTIGKLWNGTAMGPDEQVLANDPEMLYTSTSSYGDDVYFASCMDPDGPQYGWCMDADARIQLKIRFYGNSSWGAPVVANVGSGIQADVPTISVLRNGIYAGDAVVFWIAPAASGKIMNRYVMYSRYSRSNDTFQAIPTTWIDDVSGLDVIDGMQSDYWFNGNQTAVFWTRDMGGGSYQGRIALLNVTLIPQPSYVQTFQSAGVGSDATGNLVSVTVNSGPPHVFGVPPPGSLSAVSGATVSYTYQNPITSSTSGKQYRLTGITGPASGFTVAGPNTITANYVAQFQVTSNVATPAYGSVSPSTGWFDYNSPVSITASPNLGYSLSSWSISGASCSGGPASNPCTFNMPLNPVTLTANFVRNAINTNTLNVNLHLLTYKIVNVRVQLLQGSTIVATKFLTLTMARPTALITFSNIPSGTLTIRVSGYGIQTQNRCIVVPPCTQTVNFAVH